MFELYHAVEIKARQLRAATPGDAPIDDDTLLDFFRSQPDYRLETKAA